MSVTSMTLILDNLQCYILLISLLILFSTLLTLNICKSTNDLHADDELRIINCFSDLSLFFLYDFIAIIAFFYT